MATHTWMTLDSRESPNDLTLKLYTRGTLTEVGEYADDRDGDIHSYSVDLASGDYDFRLFDGDDVKRADGWIRHVDEAGESFLSDPIPCEGGDGGGGGSLIPVLPVIVQQDAQTFRTLIVLRQGAYGAAVNFQVLDSDLEPVDLTPADGETIRIAIEDQHGVNKLTQTVTPAGEGNSVVSFIPNQASTAVATQLLWALWRVHANYKTPIGEGPLAVSRTARPT